MEVATMSKLMIDVQNCKTFGPYDEPVAIDLFIELCNKSELDSVIVYDAYTGEVVSSV